MSHPLAGDRILTLWQTHLALEKRFSAHTIEAYLRDVTQALDFFRVYRENDNLSDITLAEFRAFLAHLKTDAHLAPKTMARKLAALKHFFRYLRKEHQIENTAINLVKSVKTPKTLPKPVQEVDILRLLKDFSRDTWVEKRDYALILLLYGTGLRISEALSLTIADLSQDILRIKGKGNKTRMVPLIPIIKTAIMDYLGDANASQEPEGSADASQELGTRNQELGLDPRLRGDDIPLLSSSPRPPLSSPRRRGSSQKMSRAEHDDTLVPSSCDASASPLVPKTRSVFLGEKGGPLNPGVFQRSLRNYQIKYNLPPHTTPHAFRHSFASHILQHGGDLRNIQELLGHASLTSTEVYTKVDIEALNKTFQKLHPRNNH